MTMETNQLPENLVAVATLLEGNKNNACQSAQNPQPGRKGYVDKWDAHFKIWRQWKILADKRETDYQYKGDPHVSWLSGDWGSNDWTEWDAFEKQLPHGEFEMWKTHTDTHLHLLGHRPSEVWEWRVLCGILAAGAFSEEMEELGDCLRTHHH